MFFVIFDLIGNGNGNLNVISSIIFDKTQLRKSMLILTKTSLNSTGNVISLFLSIFNFRGLGVRIGAEGLPEQVLRFSTEAGGKLSTWFPPE